MLQQLEFPSWTLQLCSRQVFYKKYLCFLIPSIIEKCVQGSINLHLYFAWSALPKTTFTSNTQNCTDDDVIWDYLTSFYYMWMKLDPTATLDKVVNHKCFKYIQEMFQDQLRAIMTVMSYSLYDNGRSINLSVRFEASHFAYHLLYLHLFSSLVVFLGKSSRKESGMTGRYQFMEIRETWLPFLLGRSSTHTAHFLRLCQVL